ncbi:hypothetical protein TW95_gp1743 [Pandoravirus inopinatum]|uniref:Uncharacterized protein n=1 Tax=Pandoravirus inopinatum TaxID=1605721 RepID=A0A0B5JF57_9VIRU|nr:hypothetical protein TW95_gp1743 [Pandoravirus inopinatum]AJF98477.1 hypothetical protein [Pandoravirus inopinatum]
MQLLSRANFSFFFSHAKIGCFFFVATFFCWGRLGVQASQEKMGVVWAWPSWTLSPTYTPLFVSKPLAGIKNKLWTNGIVESSKRRQSAGIFLVSMGFPDFFCMPTIFCAA